MSDRLTDKQRQFCFEYLQDFNATAAYQRAGYKASGVSAGRSASRLLKNVYIQGYLAELRERILGGQIASVRDVLGQIEAIAFARITDVCEFSGDSVTLKDSQGISQDAQTAIKQVAKSSQGVWIAMHDKLTALRYLMDLYGMRDDFNHAREILKRYGLLLLQSEDAPSGWEVREWRSHDIE